ncbi:MAG: CopG family transcriptional regulator [Gammaproteobacteria bacterium]|nr:CopG family transcriptional regulator [Gammaproteobacteria bacterium]MXW45244.1 CopG family transcriptional regulator [Gammaproteobacteria bacterium]MYD01160.1 CopG family transcriptional regulator [Gammaproteobacteria bacterium]
MSQKAWLDQQAVLRRVSISSLIRRAVSEYRIREQRRAGVPFEEVLNLTAGIWEAEDGFDYQERIRKEWRGALDSG